MILVIAGVLFTALGLGAAVTAAAGAAPPALLIIAIVFTVVGALLLLLGVSVARGQRRRQHILTAGVAGTARIETVTENTSTANDQPIVKLGLAVSTGDTPVYRVSVREAVRCSSCPGSRWAVCSP